MAYQAGATSSDPPYHRAQQQNGGSQHDEQLLNEQSLARLKLDEQSTSASQAAGPPRSKRVQRAYHNFATGAPGQIDGAYTSPSLAPPSQHPSQQAILNHPDHQRQDTQSFYQPQQIQAQFSSRPSTDYPLSADAARQPVPAHFSHGQGKAAYLDTAGASGTGLGPAQAQGGWDPGQVGPKLQGPRPKLDVDRIPSIVGIREEDRVRHTGRYYMTCGEEPPPLSTTDFAALDQGNSNPKFLRFATTNFPMNQEQVTASDIPMAAIFQPFANLREDESPVPLVRTGPDGPIRCQRCRAYLNAWCQIERGGTAFICNLCSHLNHFSARPFSTDAANYPDRATNPELQFGTVDYTVGEDYYAQPPTRRDPRPMSILFVIDVSEAMVRSGALDCIARSLQSALYEETLQETRSSDAGHRRSRLPPGVRIGFVTYSKTLHFYRFEPHYSRAQLMIVSEIEDAFVPIQQGLFCEPEANQTAILGFLNTLSSLVPDGLTPQLATGAACRAAYLALQATGGHVFLMTSSIPNSGPGTLKPRDTKAGYNPEHEKTLLRPQSNYYETTGMEFSEAGIGLDLLLFPLQYVDMPSMAMLSSISGGELLLYPRFSVQRHGQKLAAEIKLLLDRLRGFDITMRMRCSNGVKVSRYMGGHHQRTVTDIDLGSIGSHKAIVIYLAHEARLDPKGHVYFQTATLHTTVSGERRVRIHNVALSVTGMLANVYKYACIDATVTVLFKEAVAKIATTSLADIRESITKKCTKIMTSYRKHCASASSQAQLILPESLKAHILLSLAMLKSVALQGTLVFSDLRVYSASFTLYHGVSVVTRMLYPQLLALPAPGAEANDGELIQEVRLSKIRLRPDRLYLMITSEHALLWIGEQAPAEQLQDLLGIDDSTQLMNQDLQLRQDSAWFKWIQNVIEGSVSQSPRHINILLARKEIDAAYLTFINAMVEDANNDAYDYVDYLIQQELGLH